jgi:hypothetical protein
MCVNCGSSSCSSCTTKTSSCSERSLTYKKSGATLAAAADAFIVDATNGNIYKIVTVINDTDQDIKVTFVNSEGHNGAFTVPKSIKAFTKQLRVGTFQNGTIKVQSLGGADAVGNIYFNFSS